MTKPTLSVSPELAFVTEFLDFELATGIKNAALELHQILFMDTQKDFTIDVKGRQIGWSWGAALWGVTRAALKPGHTVFFVSISQDEADNKISIARRLLGGFDKGVLPKLIKDNTRELGFSNGSSIRSEPSVAPRGASQADIILDEYAFVKRDHEIYQALLPIVSRGGKLRIGSTPFGMRGRFHEVFTNIDTYPGYYRRSIPWWMSEGLCTDISKAYKVPDMRDRVMSYGKPRLRNIFSNTRQEEFLQEYCCSWVAGDYQWISEVELALAHQWYLLNPGRNDCIAVDTRQSPNPLDDVYDALNTLQDAIFAGRVSNALCVGYDVGRRRHTSDLVIISHELDDTYPVRLTANLPNTTYDDQLALLKQVDEQLHPEMISLDSTGIGNGLAEKAADEISTVQGVWFSGDKKSDMALYLKHRFEMGTAPVPDNDRLNAHIRSIHKEVTTSGRIVFDVYGKQAEHADAFWALALAHYGSLYGVLAEDDELVGRG